MSNYIESKQKIDDIRRKDEGMFRMAISHLMAVGARHLTDENIEDSCNEIMKQDDSHSFMTNEFKCELLRMAGELAKISNIDLLVYIQREVEYDIHDGVITYKRATDLLKNCMAEIEQNYDCENAEVLESFEDMGFDDDEIECLGFGYLIDDVLDLPKQVTITAATLALDTDDMYRDEDAVGEVLSEYLSDEYGFCHKGFKFEVTFNEFNEPSDIIVTDIEWDVDEEDVSLDDKLDNAKDRSSVAENGDVDKDLDL